LVENYTHFHTVQEPENYTHFHTVQEPENYTHFHTVQEPENSEIEQLLLNYSNGFKQSNISNLTTTKSNKLYCTFPYRTFPY